MLIDELVDPDVLDPTGHLAASDAHINALLDELGSGDGGLAGKHLLEVGCSDGWNLLTAVDRGALAWGVDTSAALLWLGRDRLPDADFRLGSPAELPFDSGSFDVVCRFGITSDGRELVGLGRRDGAGVPPRRRHRRDRRPARTTRTPVGAPLRSCASRPTSASAPRCSTPLRR